MEKEQRYIQKNVDSKNPKYPFLYVPDFSDTEKKIVFCCIEGTTGYTCNPKYIAEEFIRQNRGYELVWLVNDMSKEFPKEIEVVHNTLWNRAYQLSTAHFWIDNSRKQLEVRKRKGQVYIQTWHAKLGFKPTCLDRGGSFSRIAYIVSKHDSEMIDYVLSNSKWYDDTLPTGMIYSGNVLRIGSPRCDILVNDRAEMKKKVRRDYRLPENAKILMYAPTFRGGSQGTDRIIEADQNFLDYKKLIDALEKRFLGKWFIFLRQHPQLTVRNIDKKSVNTNTEDIVIDISRIDDMYEILAGCDAFLTDYSSAAFDAAIMKIPVFLYADDYKKYEMERGKLLWDLRTMPFPLAMDNDELAQKIFCFDYENYIREIDMLFQQTEMVEDGKAAEHMAEIIGDLLREGKV